MDAKNLVTLRESLGLTQAGLAQKLGFKAKTISRYETGASPIEPWLPLAMDSLLRELKGGPDALLARKIRNARTYKDLAEIQTLMGLTEPELPFNRAEIEAAVEGLFDDTTGLLFAADAGSEQPGYGSRARAKQYVEEWFERSFPGGSESVHFVEEDIKDFFFELIFIFSLNKATGKQASSEDDSRHEPYWKLRKSLEKRYLPFRENRVRDAGFGRLAELIPIANALEEDSRELGKKNRSDLRELENRHSELFIRLYSMTAGIEIAMEDGHEAFEISAETLRLLGEMLKAMGSAGMTSKSIGQELEFRRFTIKTEPEARE